MTRGGELSGTEPRSAWVWINDALVPDSAAAVPVHDRGFTSGDGVFESLKVVGGVPFALTRHLRRMANSADRLGLDPVDAAALRHATEQTLAANDAGAVPVGRLRITWTAGPAPSGPHRARGSHTLVVTFEGWRRDPDAALKLITAPWPRNERSILAGVKSTSYAENATILGWARAAGADEAILANTAGGLCEATSCNVVVVRGGRALTPSLSSGCLPGVTRELALDWGLVGEADLPMTALEQADEVLVTSSTRDFAPAGHVDARALPAPGPVGARLIADFRARAAADPDP